MPNASSGRFSVNVWGWISVEGPGVCWQIDGRLTGENYVNILDNVMLPSVQQIFPDNFVFQHVYCVPICSGTPLNKALLTHCNFSKNIYDNNEQFTFG
ncbi:hypothetical protein NQ315_012035 [Exocentrus adspersus]|uniref:Uncharacterized protein n=1 Tax=Exocentrus adspersus TaxID=1586481 RepID=A0AAV8VI57_9CUCU|nr:hypothetical protein NQ315_012035 [Exocentrus adspersus]